MTTEQASVTNVRLEHLVHQIDRFRAFVRSRVVDHNLADEVLQDSFARAVRAIEQVRDDERLDAWFYRILRNRIADLGQRTTALPIINDVAASPGDEATVCRCVVPLVDRLPDEDAQVLRLVDLQGLSPEFVAGMLGITPNALNVRRHRARQQLRRLLDASCGLCASEGCRDCTCPTPGLLSGHEH